MKKKNNVFTFLSIVFCCALSSCQQESNVTKTYLVKFQNYDGFVLYTSKVKSGDSINYKGPTPVRNSTNDTIFYRWTGWDKSLTNIMEDTTFTATYYQGNRYKATFINEDLVLQDYRFNENVVPSYAGYTPTKESEDEDTLFIFSGWLPELAPITEDTIYYAQYDVISKDDMITINNKDSDVFNTNIDMVKDFFELEDNPNTETNEIAKFLSDYGHRGGYSGSKGYQITWNDVGRESNSYTVQISSKSSLDPVELEIEVENDKSCYVYNLEPGTYYYRVKDNNSTGRSQIQSFTFTNRLRTIQTMSEVSNMRDIGGFRTNDNKHVKYGLIYRNANLASAGKYTDNLFTNELKIKTELDVRFSPSESPTQYDQSAHPIEGVDYQHFGLTDAYPYMITHSATIANIKNIFTLLTNGTSLPLSFHCTNGADRTGLLALLIEGALGVVDEDIYRDYELTSFCAKTSYWQPRCDIDINEGIYQFRSDGYRTDTWGNGSFEKVILDMKEAYSSPTASISETVYNFLTTKCGVTASTIETLREIMIAD